MQTFTQQQYKDAFKKSSESVRAYIIEADSRESLNALVNEFHVPQESAQQFQRLIVNALYGLIPVGQVEVVLIDEFDFQADAAKQLVERAKVTVLSCIFNPPIAHFQPEAVPTDTENVATNGSVFPTHPKTHSLTATSIHTAIDAYGLVRERLERLPESVQKTIRSPELEAGLSSLVAKYKLDSTRVASYVAEAVRVMVGLTTTNNFKMEVTRTTALDPNTLDALFLDSESTLFKPVRMAIMKALEERKTVAPTTLPPKPPSPPSIDPYREAV